MFNSANGFKTSKKMNKDWLKTFKSCCVVLFLAAQINVFTGCQDDLPADSYYTFTGEMMSDFLKNREDSSSSGASWSVPESWTSWVPGAHVPYSRP